MIIEVAGDLLRADTDVLVNAVNTAGVMGAGIAAQFRVAYPAYYREYRKACKAGEVRLGEMLVYETGLEQPRYIASFPTKGHWRDASRLEDIEAGLADLRETIQTRGIRSAAVPALGCGNGGLVWAAVRPLIYRDLAGLDDVRICLYPPQPPVRLAGRLGT